MCGAVVKLQSIAVKSSGAEGRAPRRLKLFINNASLGFPEASDFPAVQELELTQAQVEEGLPIALKCVPHNMRCDLSAAAAALAALYCAW